MEANDVGVGWAEAHLGSRLRPLNKAGWTCSALPSPRGSRAGLRLCRIGSVHAVWPSGSGSLLSKRTRPRLI
jgi:hypothetical protein